MSSLSQAPPSTISTKRSGGGSKPGNRRTTPGETLLHKLGLARQDASGAWRPSVAGVLMASDDPRRYLPNAFIQAVSYRTSSLTPESERPHYQLDATDITGPLDRQVAEALRFVSLATCAQPPSKP